MEKGDEYYLDGESGARAVRLNSEEYGDIMLSIAYNNTRKILFGDVKYEDLLDRANKEGLMLFLAHNPEDGISDEVIQEMLGYYEYTEEYEICVEIRDFLLERDGGGLDK